MRNAPSVTYPVGRCAFYVRLLVLLGALGLLSLTLWWWSDRLSGRWSTGAGQSGRIAVTGVVLWLLWAGFAWRSWVRAPIGQLQWDASTTAEGAVHPGLWRWQSRAHQGEVPLSRVDIMLDLQSRILLRLHNHDGGALWVWVERQHDPAHWNDLRRALVAARLAG